MSPLMLTDPKKITPTFYKLFHQRNICINCGKVYAHSHVRAFVAVAGDFTGVDCNEAADIQWNLPVQVKRLNDTRQPFCHECYRPDMLKHLPTPQPSAQRAFVGPSWIGKAPIQPKAPKTPTQPKAPKTFTIDDLDID